MSMDMENKMKVQIDNEVIDATDELQNMVVGSQSDAADYENLVAQAKAKAEADKAALLARLGLTEEELQTILG